MKELSKYTWRILGIIFIISSLSKAIDVFAFSAKIEEYTLALGLNIPPSVCCIGAAMVISLELFIGIFILNGVFSKYTYFASVIVILFFTILTFIVTINDSITDCGCFGNLALMSPKTSLIKNLILYLIALSAYPQSKVEYHFNFLRFRNQIITIIIFGTLITINQPLIDTSFYSLNSDLVINKNSTYSLDIDFIPNKPTNINRIGIVRNFNNIDSSYLFKLVEILSKDKSKPLILTSSIPAEVDDNISATAIMGYVDNQTLSKLISSNIGIIDLEDDTIVNKWQLDNLGIQESLLNYNVPKYILRILLITSWMSVCLMVIVSIIRSIQNVYAEKRSKSRLINNLLI